MIGPPDNLVPEDVAGQLEALVRGEGPFADVKEAELLRSEDVDAPALDDPQAEEDAAAVAAQVDARLAALEQALLNVPGVPVPVLLPDDPPFQARILGEAGSGAYNDWEEVEVDANGVWKAKTGGRTDTTEAVSLWESNDVTKIPVNTVVNVHKEIGDNLQYSFEYHNADSEGNANNSSTGSVDFDFWADINNNINEVEIDDRDWRGRVLRVTAYGFAGSGETDPDPWAEGSINHYDNPGAGPTAQTATVSFTLITQLDGMAADQNITELDGAGTDVLVEMDKDDGSLKMTVTNYAARLFYRLSIHGGAKTTLADAYVIPAAP